MKRLLQPFVLTVTAILAIAYAYVTARLGPGLWLSVALAFPFVMVWLVPVVYWVRDRDGHTRLDEAAHVVSYLSMAWLSFLVVFTLARDAALVATAWAPSSTIHVLLAQEGAVWVYAASILALV